MYMTENTYYQVHKDTLKDINDFLQTSSQKIFTGIWYSLKNKRVNQSVMADSLQHHGL